MEAYSFLQSKKAQHSKSITPVQRWDLICIYLSIKAFKFTNHIVILEAEPEKK